MKRLLITFAAAVALTMGNAVSAIAQQLPSEGIWGKYNKDTPASGVVTLTGDIRLKGPIRVAPGTSLTIRSDKDVTIYNDGIVQVGVDAASNGMSRMFTVNSATNGKEAGILTIEAADGATITIDGGADYTWTDYRLQEGSDSRTLHSCFATSGTLTLTNVTIQNVKGYDDQGGAMDIGTNTGGTTTLTGCTITRCYSERGAAIFTQSPHPLIITDSEISCCNSGGGTTNNSGGAIRTLGSTKGDMFLTNVVFENNYAQRNEGYDNHLYRDGNGGALFWNGRGTAQTTCYIDGCTFINNRCDDNGGAIKAQGSIRFINNPTVIEDNTAPFGAGIFIEGYTGSVNLINPSSITYDLNRNLIIRNNTSTPYMFEGEHNPGKGAGIHFCFNDEMTLESDSDISVEISGASITGNKVSGADGLGGGIYFENTSLPEKNYKFTINLNHGEISGNFTEDSGKGGGIYVYKEQVASNEVAGNTLTVSDNKSGAGAGIYIQDGSLSMANGNITGNSISGNGNGGGIFIENGDFTIDAGTVTGNEVFNGNGGGVYIVGSGDLGNFVMNGGSITGNSATGTQEDTGFGGGIYVNGGNFTMTEEAASGMISSNTATRDGGGVYISGGEFQQDNGSISSNVSEADGGGVCIVNGGSFTMAGGSITANGKQNSTIKTENGGGVYLNGGNFVLENGTISGNGAIENGGGVFLTGENCRYELKKGYITGNSAGNGGGVYLEKGLFILGNDVNLQDGNISSNAATFGGGVYIGSANNGSVTAADDAQDTEPTEGFIMRGGTITSNTTADDGGGIYLNGGSFLMNNGNIVGNSSSTDGGGVCIANNGNFTMNDGTITGNGKNGSDIVTTNGGGVYLDGGRLIVSAGNISDNAATASGGGVYISNGSVEMGDGEVLSNTCGAYGGGIYVYNDPKSAQYKDVEVSGGSLLKNTAVYGGGICVDGPINLNIGNVEIAENKATNGGGVCLMNSANMTFGAGQIKNNIANKSEGSGTYQKTTAYQKDITEVEGIGGGIYLNSNTRLVFNDTDELGLFGNKADNGADEIFANGKETFVNLPNVTGMALDGYPGAGNLKWLEDYITDDTEYDEGTFIRNKYSPGAWATDGKNMRYRDAISQNERNWIFELEGEANAENGLGNKYICFALGYEIVSIRRSTY